MAHYSYLVGASAGFLAFVYSVHKTGDIFYRSDSFGKKRFHINGFVGYLTEPFKLKYPNAVWGNVTGLPLMQKLDLLTLNWLVMTSLGVLSVLLYRKVVSPFFCFVIHKIVTYL